MYLLPIPQSIVVKQGLFSFRRNIEVCIETGIDGLLDCAKLIANEISVRYAISPKIVSDKAPRDGAINLFIKNQPRKEQYTLVITPESILVEGSDSVDVRYGIQTLRQIVRQSTTDLKCVEILDYPALPNRGFFHDVTRGQIPTLQSLKHIADKMAEYKLNQMQLYIEHSYLLKGYSEIWRDDDPLTAEEILELDAYCKMLGIELVPSIACFGHLYKVLSTQSYCHLCELDEALNDKFSFIDRMHHHTLDVSNPESFEMAKDLINQYLPLFSSHKFNIGADETFDLGKGKNKAVTEEIGSARLYVDFLKKLIQFVKDNGKEPMFWGDIVLKHPELLKEIPEDIICLNWGYRATVTDDGTRTISESGIPQYLCSGINGWNHFLPDYHTAYTNISKMSSFALRFNTLGLLNTNWGDYGNLNLLEPSIPGLIMGAAFSWNDNIPSHQDLNRMISAVEYGDNNASIMDTILKITYCERFDWTQAIYYIEKGYTTITMTAERSRKFFDEVVIDDLQSSNLTLDRCLNQLYSSITKLEQDKRSKLYPYLVMSQGIKIFNKICACIKGELCNSLDKIPYNPTTVAAELEEWILDYKAEWRKTSKESELYRILDILFSYANLLRKM